MPFHRVESVFSTLSVAVQRWFIIYPWNGYFISSICVMSCLRHFSCSKHFFWCQRLFPIWGAHHIFIPHLPHQLISSHFWSRVCMKRVCTRLVLLEHVQQLSIRVVSSHLQVLLVSLHGTQVVKAVPRKSLPMSKSTSPCPAGFGISRSQR